MRLADLPSTRVVDGRRQKRRPVGTPPSEAEAYRALLADAQEAYQQALGCVVMLTNKTIAQWGSRPYRSRVFRTSRQLAHALA